MNSLKNCFGASIKSIKTSTLLFKKTTFVLAVVASCLMFNACSSSSEEMQSKEALAEAAAILNGQSAITTDTINGVTHNFIRTANLKCKVKDVLNATKNIEDVVAQNGGYVSKSDLNSIVNYNNTVQVKKDSVLEMSYYNTVNTMTIRVPNKLLDTVIRKITALALFVDYRKLSSDDVKLKLVANKLAEARLLKFNHNVAKKSNSTKATEKTTVSTETAILDKQEQADESKIDSYDLADQVNYSTVQLEIYQDQKISSLILPKPEVPEVYETPFFTKLGSAFVNGFELLKTCLLFLINSWGLILVLVVAFLVIKKILKRN